MSAENNKPPMSAAMERILKRVDDSKERKASTQYPFLPSGNHHARVKKVLLFKNKDGITNFKLELDVVKSSAPGVSGVHVVILSYKGAMSDAHQEETKQILSAVMSSQLDLVNDATTEAIEEARAAGGEMDKEILDSVKNYKFSPLVRTTTGEAIEQGWLEVDFGDDGQIPCTFDLNAFDLFVYTNSYDKKLWEDPKKKTIPKINTKTGAQMEVVVHNWRGCSVSELRKEGILQ